MEKVILKANKWGNSLGLRISKVDAIENGIKDGDNVEVIILPKTNWRKLFGSLKTSKTAQEIKDELRGELHGIR